MTREEVIKLLQDELERCQRAAELNGCEMKPEWQRAMDVCRVAVEALREQEQRRWVPVEDRLPEESGDYIVYYSNTASNKPLISMRHFYGEIPEAFLHNKAMTHWMPLPEPPKEE